MFKGEREDTRSSFASITGRVIRLKIWSYDGGGVLDGHMVIRGS